MSLFLEAQPEAMRSQVSALLSAGAVQMAILLELDFATTPLRLSNRTVGFTDLKWGKVWGQGDGLLVGLPDVSGGDDELAPFREYRLGLPTESVRSDKSATWRADVVEMVGDVTEYRGRDAGLYGQLFDPATGQPAGHPFALDIGIMDKMSAAFMPGGAVVSLTVESFLSRKGVPVYGMQTYLDQKRRYPTDEGLQFVTEASKLITWTDW